MRHVFRYTVAHTPSPGDLLALAPDDARHLTRVVRRGPGDAVELIDPAGTLWAAAVEAVGPPETLVRVTGPGVGAPAAPLTLYQGLCEWGRLDMVVEKAVELGVREIVVFASERARRVPDAGAWARRSERLARVVEAAARQSGQTGLARVRGLVAFGDIVAETTTGEGYLIDPRGAHALGARLRAEAPSRVALAVGPEAGFSPGEVAAAHAGGIAVCSLGPGVLRAETAAVVGAAVALDALGRLSPEPG